MRAVFGGLLLVLAACSTERPPEGQVLLYVTTDAPVPTLDGEPGLFDRLRIDVYPGGALEPCVGCSRTFAVDRDLIDRGEASMGIVPEVGVDDARVRVRLYRDGGTISAEPRPGSTLDTWVAVPAIEEEGIVEVTVTLRTDDVATTRGTPDAPIAATAGPPETGLASSWPHGAHVPCGGSPGEGEACIPGGVFWMGDPRLDLSSVGDMDGELERLVVISPFILDQDEVTVAEFRASGLAILAGNVSDNPHEANTGIPDCTYTTMPSMTDDLPVNCVSWHLSQAYCESVGKTLPTEAQLEWAMSNLGRTRYPWGEDSPSCEDAVHGRDDRCGFLGNGPALAGSGRRDRVTFDREIVDLAANVHEWAADMWQREDESCWGIGLFVDPRCDTASGVDAEGRSFRGGSYAALDLSLRAAVRGRVFNERFAVSPLLGFRCARPVTP